MTRATGAAIFPGQTLSRQIETTKTTSDGGPADMTAPELRGTSTTASAAPGPCQTQREDRYCTEHSSGFDADRQGLLDDSWQGPSTGPALPRQTLHLFPVSSEEVIPRALLSRVIDLFFEYVYAIAPCVHKPSFLLDMTECRETRHGEEEWMALVLAIAGVTLVQLPRSLAKLTKTVARDLVLAIAGAVSCFLDAEYTTTTLSRCM